MANLPSVEKRHRQSLKRRARNVQKRSQVKTAVKKLREIIAKKDPAAALAALRDTAKVLDKAASKGVIKKANASRRIARLSKAIQHLSAAK